MNCLLLLAIVALCTGCPSGAQSLPQREISAIESSCEEGSANERICAEDADERPAQTDLIPLADSMEFSEGCAWYICYFAAGTRNKEALKHIRDVIYDAGPIGYEEFDPASIDRYRAHLLDSISSLEWLDSEPWPSMRRLFLAWKTQLLECRYIVCMAERDPAFLYDCSETDSVLVRCADLLQHGGDDREAVRRLRREIAESEYAERVVRDSLVYDDKELESIFSSIDWVVDRNNPRELLFTMLHNHIIHKIHDRLGKNGTVDFYDYSDDFLRIFDSVKIEVCEL